MEVGLSEVKLKNGKVGGMSWKLKGYKEEVEEEDGVGLVWEWEKGIGVLGCFEMGVEWVLKMGLGMGLIGVGGENKVWGSDMLGRVLKDVSLMEEGKMGWRELKSGKGLKEEVKKMKEGGKKKMRKMEMCG